MREIRADQKGFTLAELLVVIMISAVVMLAITGVMLQLVRSGNVSARMAAIRETQTAGFWMSKDGVQTVDSTISAGAGFPCTFIWSDITTPEEFPHVVVYRLISMPSGTLMQLQREETVGGVLDSTKVVARSLYADGTSGATSVRWTDSTKTSFTFRVVATVALTSENRTYQVSPRFEPQI